MPILVVAATEAEIAPFSHQFPDADVLITGVGMHAAIFELTKALHQHKYEQVVQVGIAGAYNENHIGQAFLVSRDCFADLGVWENGSWKTIFDLGFSNPAASPFTNGWIVNRHPLLQQADGQTLPAISVNLLSDKHDWIQLMQQQYDAGLESMEGAAFHFVCEKMQLPYIQIRGVSNRIGERDKTKWQIKEAIQASCALLSEVYLQLKKD